MSTTDVFDLAENIKEFIYDHIKEDLGPIVEDFQRGHFSQGS